MTPSLRLLIPILLLLALVPAASAADVSGKWSGTLAMVDANGNPGEPSSAYVILKQSGTTLTGSGGPDENQQWAIQKGKIEGNKLTIEVTAPDGTYYQVVATVDGNHMMGSVAIAAGGQSQKAKIDLKKLP